MPTCSFWVKGKVQGVFYRATAQEIALSLGVTGWVRNLPDGRVEIQATGTEKQLQDLEAWCWDGPPKARVLSVTSQPLPEMVFEGFQIYR